MTQKELKRKIGEKEYEKVVREASKYEGIKIYEEKKRVLIESLVLVLRRYGWKYKKMKKLVEDLEKEIRKN